MYRKKIANKLCAGLWLLANLIACASQQKTDSLLDYTETAERQYEKAMDEFIDEDCVSADKIFGEVRKAFPYSRFAVLSELRMADCQFIQGNHAEASILYQQFIKAHPTHEEAHYAAFRRGLCYYEMIPGDWVVTPPPHERDQSATRDARGAFSGFLATYPESSWRGRAEELLLEVEDALVRHEIYVAKFYISRDDRNAAAVRLEGIRSLYPESSLIPDAMFMQALTFLEMNELDKARHVLNEITTHYPSHYQSRRAKEYLRYIGGTGAGAKRGNNGQGNAAATRKGS